MKKLRPVLITAVVIAVLFCAFVLPGLLTHFNYEGSWTGHSAPKPKEGANNVPYQLSKVELTVNLYEFKMKEAGMPYTGSVHYSGGKAYLKIETMLGRPIEQATNGAKLPDIELRPGKEKDTIVFDDPAAMTPGVVILHRPNLADSEHS